MSRGYDEMVLEALRALEWRDTPDGPRCATCGANREAGHDFRCPLDMTIEMTRARVELLKRGNYVASLGPVVDPVIEFARQLHAIDSVRLHYPAHGQESEPHDVVRALHAELEARFARACRAYLTVLEQMPEGGGGRVT